MRKTTASWRHGLIATAIVAMMSATGCAFDPTDVPVPGTTIAGPTYQIEIEFADVLNLPPGAKVIADGVEVGNLTDVEVRGPAVSDVNGAGYVVARVEITSAVRLPADTTAELRQATPLGDVHIALTTLPGSSSPPLGSGATIELSQTRRAPQVEDTMAGLAAAVGSGTFQSFQDIVRQFNTVLPDDPAVTARVFGVLGADIQDLAGDLESVDALLAGLTDTTRVFVDRGPQLRAMLTQDGVDHIVSVFGSVLQIIVLTTLLGPIAHNALWLTPLVEGLDEFTSAILPVLYSGSPLDLSAPSNAAKVVDLIQTKLIPFTGSGPKVDVSLQVSGTEQTGAVIDALRMIGVVQ